MSALEARTKPILTPLATGVQRDLDLVQQLTLATWAAKTSIVIERTFPGPPDHFPLAQARIVKEEDRPPADVWVFAAAVEGPIPPMSFLCARVHQKVSGTSTFDLNFYTIQVGTCVLQVVRPFPPVHRYTSLARSGIEVAGELSIFPPRLGAKWPSNVPMSWEALIEYSRRGIQIPDGWAPDLTNQYKTGGGQCRTTDTEAIERTV